MVERHGTATVMAVDSADSIRSTRPDDSTCSVERDLVQAAVSEREMVGTMMTASWRGMGIMMGRVVKRRNVARERKNYSMVMTLALVLPSVDGVAR